MLFEPRVCGAELLFRTFLCRNSGQRRDRETPSLGPMHCAHTDPHGQSPAILRGQEELFAAPALLTDFLSKCLEASIVFSPKIQLPGIAADDCSARIPVISSKTVLTKRN